MSEPAATEAQVSSTRPNRELIWFVRLLIGAIVAGLIARAIAIVWPSDTPDPPHFPTGIWKGASALGESAKVVFPSLPGEVEAEVVREDGTVDRYQLLYRQRDHNPDGLKGVARCEDSGGRVAKFELLWGGPKLGVNEVHFTLRRNGMNPDTYKLKLCPAGKS